MIKIVNVIEIAIMMQHSFVNNDFLASEIDVLHS
jgi:hypothetical protein